MKVDVLTPLHIGTGREIPDFEYQWDRDNELLLRLSLSSMVTSDQSAANSLSELAARDGVIRYLRARRDAWGQHVLYRLGAEGRDFDSARLGSPGLSVRECEKASFDKRPLLPGSSLKGALLTGWLFGDAWEDAPERDRRKLLDDRASDLDCSIEPALYKTLTDLRANPEWGGKSDPGLSDILLVPDVGFESALDIHEANRRTKDRDIIAWIECVPHGAMGSAPAAFRNREVRKRKRYTVSNLCQRCNTFASCILVAEQQFFDYCVRKGYLASRPSAYSPSGSLATALDRARQSPFSCLVRAGWASTKNATSLTLLNSKADLRFQPEGRTSERRRPKSRWALKNGEPLGWCLVTFEPSDQQ